MDFAPRKGKCILPLFDSDGRKKHENSKFYFYAVYVMFYTESAQVDNVSLFDTDAFTHVLAFRFILDT